MTMAERAIGYYGDPFEGFRGVTQVDPLLPNISNVVLDAFISNWPMIMVEEALGTEVLYQSVQ